LPWVDAEQVEQAELEGCGLGDDRWVLAPAWDDFHGGERVEDEPSGGDGGSSGVEAFDPGLALAGEGLPDLAFYQAENEQFWAPWCGPCRMMAPVLEQIAVEHAGRLRVVSLNADENPVTASQRAVLAMPTLQLYVAGELVAEIVGARSKSRLIRELSEHTAAIG
jgi:thioredoxin 1